MENSEERSQFQVEIPAESIYWKIHTVPVIRGKEKLVRLEWGWTAGMTEEEIKNDYAEDAPTGSASVVTNLELAKELRDDLDRVIKELELK